MLIHKGNVIQYPFCDIIKGEIHRNSPAKPAETEGT